MLDLDTFKLDFIAILFIIYNISWVAYKTQIHITYIVMCYCVCAMSLVCLFLIIIHQSQVTKREVRIM